MNEQANAKGATMTPNDQTKVNADSLDGGESIQTTLGELWELLDEGTHEAWPECIQKHDVIGFWTYEGRAGFSTIDEEHALAIVRDHIEGWLETMALGGYWVRQLDGMYRLVADTFDESESTLFFGTLPDAVRYALGKEKE